MLINLTSIRPKIGPVNEIADLLGINYENAKTICRRYKNGSTALEKLKKSIRTSKRVRNYDQNSHDASDSTRSTDNCPCKEDKSRWDEEMN